MRAALLLALALLPACAVFDALSASSTSAADGGGGGDGGTMGPCTAPPCRELVAELPGAPPTRDLDLLFVIDNSNSMKEEQDALTTALPHFLEVLAGVAGGLPNLHVGVISTDVGTGYVSECTATGDHGLLQARPRSACQPPSGNYISDVANTSGGRDKNYSGALGDAFACIAKLGITGCGIEEPLESMRLALNGSNPENAGFLRAGSFLAVVILTDEDDCSVSDDRVLDPDPALDSINSTYGVYSSFRCTEFGVTCDGKTIARAAADYAACQSRGDSYLYHPSTYATFLKGLRDPTQLFVAAIAAPATPFGVQLSASTSAPQLKPSCQTASGKGDPAVRLRDLVNLFAGHSASASICAADLSAPMQEFARQLSALLSGSCLYGLLLDSSPAAGLQPDCKVTQVTGTTRTNLPSCASGPQPCFELVVDPAVCPYSPGQLRVAIKRTGAAPAGTRYAVECFRP